MYKFIHRIIFSLNWWCAFIQNSSGTKIIVGIMFRGKYYLYLLKNVNNNNVRLFWSAGWLS